MFVDDARRLRALEEYRILDTASEPVFDNIAALTARIFRVPISLVSFVAKDRQWFKAHYGLDFAETPRSWSFCDQAVRNDTTLVVPDASQDARFSENPLVTGPEHIRFYCGAPLRSPDGQGLGTLCVLDRVSRVPAPGELSLLETLARQVELELEIHRRLHLLDESLVRAHERQRSRDLLAAMMVHDMRNPLTVISALALTVEPADPESREDLRALIAESERLRRMLADILDLCLHDMGGLRVRREVFAIGALAHGVAARGVRAISATQPRVTVEDAGSAMVEADPELVTRVLENLVGNALHHAAGAAQVRMVFSRHGNRLRCEVRDDNALIPAAARDAIFDALAQGATPSSHRGHGLGLAFCRMVLTAHDGVITVRPNEDGIGNCFEFDLPAV
jgi:K+-sensing histidine kinase KdpD